MATKNILIPIRASREEADMLDALAKKTTRSRSGMVRHLIKHTWVQTFQNHTSSPAAEPVEEATRQ
jgi:predicted DNA-binding protein